MSAAPRKSWSKRLSVHLGALAASALVGCMTPAASASPAGAPPDRGEQPPASAVATYHGEKIDLAKSWQGARICAQSNGNEFRCYDNEKQFRTDAQLPLQNQDGAGAEFKSCPNGWACLHDLPDGGGRTLKWDQNGTYDLKALGFQNQATSWSKYNGCAMDLYDAQPGWDPYVTMWGDQGNLWRTGDGNWDNIADSIVTSSCES